MGVSYRAVLSASQGRKNWALRQPLILNSLSKIRSHFVNKHEKDNN